MNLELSISLINEALTHYNIPIHPNYDIGIDLNRVVFTIPLSTSTVIRIVVTEYPFGNTTVSIVKRKQLPLNKYNFYKPKAIETIVFTGRISEFNITKFFKKVGKYNQEFEVVPLE